jgi:tetratricopeptide (TPR) repeat protein
VVAAGCATSAALRHGADAERRQDYDSAVVEYTKAVRQKPDDLRPEAVDRAKIRASQDHWNTARRLSATGKLDLALRRYELASELNPTNGDPTRNCAPPQ